MLLKFCSTCSRFQLNTKKKMDVLQTTIHDAYRSFTEFSDQTVFPMIPENDYISSDRCRFILGISMVSFIIAVNEKIQTHKHQAHSLTFWSLTIIFALVVPMIPFLQRFKLEHNAKQPPRELVLKACRNCILNHLVGIRSSHSSSTNSP